MRWRDGHEKLLLDDHVVTVVVLGILAAAAYALTGWPLVLPPETFGYDREMN